MAKDESCEFAFSCFGVMSPQGFTRGASFYPKYKLESGSCRVEWLSGTMPVRVPVPKKAWPRTGIALVDRNPGGLIL